MLTACSSFDSFKHTFLDKKTKDVDEKTILIGVFEPQTGRYSEKGQEEIKGIELANSIYNSVNGYHVELVKVDTQSSTGAAKTAIQSLIKMKPVAIIGSAGEATSLIASKYVDEAKIPAIAPSSTNPLITQNYNYYFRTSVTSSQMGTGVADYAYEELESRHIGIVTAQNDTAAASFLNGFNEKIDTLIKEDNDEESKEINPVVMEEELDIADEGNILQIINEIKKNRVDTLFIPLGAEAMDSFLSAAEKNGLSNINFIGTNEWGNPEFIDMMKKHEGMKIAFPYESVLNGGSNSMTHEADRFRIEYANKYGTDELPTDSAALGYDSYLLLINAIHNAGSIKGPEIRQALLDLKDIQCATGVFNFDSHGNTVRPVNISTIKNGKVVSLHKTQSDTESIEVEELEK